MQIKLINVKKNFYNREKLQKHFIAVPICVMKNSILLLIFTTLMTNNQILPIFLYVILISKNTAFYREEKE